MKEEALKLADELEKPVSVPNQPDMIYIDGHRMYGAQMIRRLVQELDKQEYRKTHEGFSTLQEVIAKHEAIPSRKEAIDKAREWIKDYRIESIFEDEQTNPVAWASQNFNIDGKPYWYTISFDRTPINNIPLYTTPQTKPLSEVEIVNMFYSPKYRYDEDGHLNFIAFARAIEERHGIK